MTYFEFLHSLTINTRPALAIVPKAAQAASPANGAEMAARYLGTRQAYMPNGTSYLQERWSHAMYQVTGHFVRLEDGNRSYIVNAEQVRIVTKKDVA